MMHTRRFAWHLRLRVPDANGCVETPQEVPEGESQGA